MNIIEYVKKHTLKCTDAELAEICDVSRMAVMRWRKGVVIPHFQYIIKLRAEIVRRDLPWDDSYWFDPPTQGD